LADHLGLLHGSLVIGKAHAVLPCIDADGFGRWAQ
jgi:hypothetical protein